MKRAAVFWRHDLSEQVAFAQRTDAENAEEAVEEVDR